MSLKNDVDTELRQRLYQDLSDRFSEDELRTLCFRIGVDYENLSGEGKSGKARELVLHLERFSRVNEFVEIGKRIRPDLSWDVVSAASSRTRSTIQRHTTRKKRSTSGDLRVWRIFIASPSDVAKERKWFEKIVIELNDGEADNLNIHIELLDWKSKVIPLLGRPQQIILDQLKLEETDLLILILWHRFGTPPGSKDPHSGRMFQAGIEEEFTLAYDLWLKRKRPQIAVYHCTRPASPAVVDGDQLTKLQAFLKGFEPGGTHPGLVQEYTSLSDFRERVRRDLVRLLHDFAE